MEAFLMKAFQLVVALAMLVIIHEFGHYITARLFGIKVEKFYLFFNPWFSLVKWHPEKKKQKYDKHGNPKASWRDTEYGIGWVPLGGYVKIAGMIDESMDREQMAKPAEPWEFRSKPACQRLLVMLGGVIFNFVLAIIIYAGIAFCWGNKYVPLDKAYEGMDFAPEAQAIGFRNGDIPLSADGKPLSSGDNDFVYRMVNASTVSVLRNHTDTVDIAIPDDFIFRLDKDKGFMQFRVPVYVSKIITGEPAEAAGIMEGDRILAIDTISTRAYSELAAALQQYAGKPVVVTVERAGKLLRLNATPTEGAKLGFQLKLITDVYPTVTEHYSLLKSVPKGWEIGIATLSNYVGSMKYVFTKDGAKSIGGFGAIGDMFPERWSWYSFWQITAFLSVALAFMNILPIPALDGGHVLFLLWEIVTRRKPNEKVMEYAQVAGMCILLLLLVYANGNDLMRGIQHWLK